MGGPPRPSGWRGDPPREKLLCAALCSAGSSMRSSASASFRRSSAEQSRQGRLSSASRYPGWPIGRPRRTDRRCRSRATTHAPSRAGSRQRMTRWSHRVNHEARGRASDRSVCSRGQMAASAGVPPASSKPGAHWKAGASAHLERWSKSSGSAPSRSSAIPSNTPIGGSGRKSSQQRPQLRKKRAANSNADTSSAPNTCTTGNTRAGR
mmetsp:Transcript_9255/g.28760  ORF Transcript_9255/g.28760 Transcript_9255/m.28760 type:complete len:208 (-) Transcript_9255:985-1608(-)